MIQQLREAFPDESALRYLIYDNDSIFSEKVTEAIECFGMRSEPRIEAHGRMGQQSGGLAAPGEKCWITLSS